MTDKKVYTQVDEAQPMGMFRKLGNTVASKFGSTGATGRLETGKLANQVMKQYQLWLGRAHIDATDTNLMQFLSSNGYPTTAAQKALTNMPGFRNDTATATPMQGVAAPATGTPAPTAADAGITENRQVHTVDLMRSYLSILNEEAPLTNKMVSDLIMAAVGEYSQSQALPGTNTADGSMAGPKVKQAPAAPAPGGAAPARPAASAPTTYTSPSTSTPAPGRKPVDTIISLFGGLAPQEQDAVMTQLQTTITARGNYAAESRRRK